MATFFGGETITGTIDLFGTTTTTPATIYTVPAGKYAEIYIQRIVSNNPGATYIVGPTTYETVAGVPQLKISDTLYQGQIIRMQPNTSGANLTYFIFIKEFSFV